VGEISCRKDWILTKGKSEVSLCDEIKSPVQLPAFKRPTNQLFNAGLANRFFAVDGKISS